MKVGWEESTLGDVCSIISGSGFPKKFQGIGKGEYPFYKVGDMNTLGNEKSLGDANNYISEETRKQLGARILPAGSIVFPKVGGAIQTNKKRQLIQPSCIDNNVMGLAPNEKAVSSAFLSWWMQSVDIYDFSNKAALPSITKKTVSSWPFPLPPLEEQKRIVAILDEAFAGLDRARAQTKANLQNAHDLFASFLNNTFTQGNEGWIEEKMNDVCNIITCGVASTPKYVDEEDGIPFLSAQNVKDGTVNLKKYKFISKEFHQKLTKKNKPSKGDILYSRVGAKFGEAGVVEHDFEFSVYVSLTLIRPIPGKLNSYFLKYFLNSPATKTLAKRSILSSGVPNLNVKTVREFLVTYPNVEHQKKLVKEMDVIKEKCQFIQTASLQKLNDLDDLRQSILQKTFAGELT